LCGEVGHRDLGCGYDLFLILRVNHEEEKIPRLGDGLLSFLGRGQGNNSRRDYLRYLAQFPIQINNNTTRPRLIYNMMLP
jgi:hypothetical protein